MSEKVALGIENDYIVRANVRFMKQAAVAAVVLAVAGAAGRLAERQLQTTGASSEPAQLASFPQHIGTWTGTDSPLDSAVARTADADAYLCRTYGDRARRSTVSLYIADGVRTRDLLPHRPEVCYAAAGWTLESAVHMDVSLGDGTTLPARLYRFGRGALDGRKVAVLNFFVVDGQVTPAVDRLRAAMSRAARSRQVQITCARKDAVGSDDGDMVCDFARSAGPALLELLGVPRQAGRP